METQTPRLRARVGNGEDGKFYFEMSMWTFDGETRIGEPWTFGPFESEKQAHVEMKEIVQKASEELVRLQGGKPTGKYIDMKNGGVLRPWKEHS